MTVFLVEKTGIFINKKQIKNKKNKKTKKTIRLYQVHLTMSLSQFWNQCIYIKKHRPSLRHWHISSYQVVSSTSLSQFWNQCIYIKKHRPSLRHWHISSYQVVSSTPHNESESVLKPVYLHKKTETFATSLTYFIISRIKYTLLYHTSCIKYASYYHIKYTSPYHIRLHQVHFT